MLACSHNNYVHKDLYILFKYCDNAKCATATVLYRIADDHVKEGWQ